MAGFRIRRLRAVDRAFVAHFLERHRLPETTVSRGRLHSAEDLPGLVALAGSDPVGLLVYAASPEGLEIVLFHATESRIGLGAALLREAKRTARRQGCDRLWVVVTNDDTKALRFYQRNGFRLVALYAEARDAARTLKPDLPTVGADGIPIRDELELELELRGRSAETAAL